MRQGTFLRTTAAACFAVVILALPRVVGAAEWIVGTEQHALIRDCASGFVGIGPAVMTAYYGERNGTFPQTGDSFYVSVRVLHLPEIATCAGGSSAQLDVFLPPNTFPAISANSPIRCFEGPWSGVGQQMAEKTGAQCPQTLTPSQGGLSYRAPTGDRWWVARGRAWEFWIPLVVRTPLSGVPNSCQSRCFVAQVRAYDGADNPLIFSTLGLRVPPYRADLALDFGPSAGIWLRRGTAWSQLHSLSAEALQQVDDGTRDELLIDFGPSAGVWVWDDGLWGQLHSFSPGAMVAADFDGDGRDERAIFDFQGLGLWVFHETGGWSQLHPSSASQLIAANLDGRGGEELVVNFPGQGLWILANGTWSQLHPFDVSSLQSGDLDGNGSEELIVNFPRYGVWSFQVGLGWRQIHPTVAVRLAAGDLDGNGTVDLAVDFGSGVGLWIWVNRTTWIKVHDMTTEAIATGDLNGDGVQELVVDFGSPGVWSYEVGRGWQLIHNLSPRAMAVGRFH